MARLIEDGELVTRSELPGVVGVSKGRISQLADRLPPPTLRTRGGDPLWRWVVIDTWNRKRKGGSR